MTLPFIALVAVLLGLGLITLLIVNNWLAEGSFQQAKLRADQIQLFEQEQALRQEVERLSSPTLLRAEAKSLGMVSAATTAYFDPATGTMMGTPWPAGFPLPISDTVSAAMPDSAPVDILKPTSSPTATAGAGSATTPTPSASPATGTAATPLPTAGALPQLASPSPAASQDGAAVSGGISPSPDTAYDRAVVSGGNQ